jgi:alpha-L-fucosidase
MNAKSLLRWVGNENGVAPENCWSTTLSSGNSYTGVFPEDELSGSPFGSIWSPGECDVPLRSHQAFGSGWFWKKGEDRYVLSPDHFLDLYYQSVGRNTNLLIGLVIDDQGLIPEADTKSLRELGKKIKSVYAHKIDETFGNNREYTLDVREKQAKTIAIMEDWLRLSPPVISLLFGFLPSVRLGHKRITAECFV